MIDELLRLADRAIGPIRHECNRRAVVAMVACSFMRGVDPDRAARYGRIVGNHVLTQRRIDLSLRIR
jgi:hypothetical protein